MIKGRKYTSSGNPYGAPPKRERKRGETLLRVLIILVLLALLGIAGFTQYRESTLLPENALATVSQPVQNVFAKFVSLTSDYVERIKLRNNLEYEYNQLKSQNDQLMYEALLNSELQDEVERLKKLLDVYEEKKDMNPIMASVTARESGNWFSTFEINRGTNDGIAKDMAVIANDGNLIGRVYEVFATSAKVITIIDSNSSISGLIESSRDQGMVKGSLGLDGQPLCRMYYLPMDTVPRPGDKVLTSGLGLAFPKGLVIGTVRESTRAMEEGKYYIVVEPETDFQHIEEVLVLRYEATVEEMPEGLYDDGELELVGLPPAPEAVEIDQTVSEPTAVPIPGAPGRATAVPAGAEGADEGAGEDDGSTEEGDGSTAEFDPMYDGEELLSEEEAAMREAFLNQE